MDHARFSLVLIRLLLALTGVTYAVLRLIRPEILPLYFAREEETATLNEILPLATNTKFAIGLLLFVIALGLYIITATLWTWRQETKKYRVPLPTATAGVQVALIVQSSLYTYYFFLGALAGARWIFALVLTLISWVIVVYEVRQSNEYDV